MAIFRIKKAHVHMVMLSYELGNKELLFSVIRFLPEGQRLHHQRVCKDLPGEHWYRTKELKQVKYCVWEDNNKNYEDCGYNSLYIIAQASDN